MTDSLVEGEEAHVDRGRRALHDPLLSVELERTGRSQVCYTPSAPRTLPVAPLAAEAQDPMCADKWL